MKIMNYVRKVVYTAIICLAIFSIYLKAVNSEMVSELSGVRGNYFYNVTLDHGKVINEVVFCQIQDERLVVRLYLLGKDEAFRPLNNKDDAYESALESLKAAKIYVQSASGKIVAAHYNDNGRALSFKSSENIRPGKYTLNIVLPDIKDQPSNINVHASKTSEYIKFQPFMVIRKHVKCY